MKLNAALDQDKVLISTTLVWLEIWYKYWPCSQIYFNDCSHKKENKMMRIVATWGVNDTESVASLLLHLDFIG